MSWPFNTAILGAGGKKPRLDALRIDSGETRTLLTLPLKNSAYAIDIEDESGTLAVGTRAGLVYILPGNWIEKTDELSLTQKLAQGAPILSVCWVNRSVLAVSDTAKRCVIWNANQKETPRTLDTKGETISSLLKLEDGLLAGLSSRGKIFFWEPGEGRLARTIDVPLPPPKSGLVRMIYWPAENALAYPGTMGRLTLFDLKKDNLRHLNAHEGAFYAISSLGERLLTAGMEDGLMKVWEAGSEMPTLEFEVVEGVISADVSNDQPAKVILVEAQGKASTYTLEENKLGPAAPISREDYRVVFIPSPQKMRAIYERRREEQVRQIVKEIQNGRGHMAANEIEDLHARLKQLGYEQATLEGNTIQALRFSVSLMRIFPKDDPKYCLSMERYANLLEDFWHLPEAEAVYRQILAINSNYRFLATPPNLDKIAESLNEMLWVIEPEIPIEDIIESATTIGKRFMGRYVIKKLEQVSCGRVQLKPEAIVEKYERVRQESRKGALPTATDEQVRWFSRQGREQVRLVAFGQGATNNIRGLQFAVQVLCGDLDTVVVPVVLFDWRDALTDETVEEGNKKASDTLTRIKSNGLSNAYLGAVHEALTQSLRRLINEKRPERTIR
jgi:hypothetical protein